MWNLCVLLCSFQLLPDIPWISDSFEPLIVSQEESKGDYESEVVKSWIYVKTPHSQFQIIFVSYLKANLDCLFLSFILHFCLLPLLPLLFISTFYLFGCSFILNHRSVI